METWRKALQNQQNQQNQQNRTKMPPTEASYADAPRSPPHPAADEEPNLPAQPIADEDLDFLDLNPEIDAKLTTPKPATPPIFDHKEDFEPIVKPSPISHSQTNEIRRLSAAQRTKFNVYVEEKLMHIQRRFVQSFGLNAEIGYRSLLELLTDVKDIVNFIWLSIEKEDLQLTRVEYQKLPTTLFGQTDYLITIANDILEYIVKLPLTDREETPVAVIKLINSLDNKFAKLIEGLIPGGKPISRTEAVRITGIAERTRYAITNDFFDKNKIEGFHYELSKLYEKVFDSLSLY